MAALGITLTREDLERIDQAAPKDAAELGTLRGHGRGEPLNRPPAVPTSVMRPAASRDPGH